MSLATYKSRCIEKYKSENPDKDIPTNMGCKWTDIEEVALLENIRNNVEIEEIAKKHKRTHGAITARLEVIAIRMYQENRHDTEYIEEVTRMNKRSIEDAIYKKNINKNKYETKYSDIEVSNLKKEIDELKAIVKDMVEINSRNKRDDIDDLKKQIQNMLDINNIKNDIIELKNAVCLKI